MRQILAIVCILCLAAPAVAETFRDADAVMTPILGRPLTSYIFVDANDPAALKQAEMETRSFERAEHLDRDCVVVADLTQGADEAQQFDDAVTHAAAAVHGDAGRLVDDEQALVFVQHVVEDVVRQLRRRRRAIRIDSRGRNSDLVTLGERVLGMAKSK